mmetsp:Transcript_20225/g.30277  ORF Transcript_20225/g.30277 Transcript_20225/m.30277 type:complete len:202 (+) Transcript_20225:808-1413(+)
MTCARESITSHSSVVFGLILCLTIRRESHNYVSNGDITVIDYVRSLHSTNDSRINDDASNKISHISCFASGRYYIHSAFAEHIKNAFSSLNESFHNASRNKTFISTDCAREEYIICCSNTKQVICVHNDCVLSNSFPHRDIPSFFPVHVSQRRLCPSTVGMHNDTVLFVTTEIIWNDLAESFWEKSFINIFDCIMDVLLIS